MSDVTKEQLVSWIMLCMPDPASLRFLCVDPDKVKFTWRGTRYRVSIPSMLVEQIGDGVLIGSDSATLVQALIRKQRERDTLKAA